MIVPEKAKAFGVRNDLGNETELFVALLGPVACPEFLRAPVRVGQVERFPVAPPPHPSGHVNHTVFSGRPTKVTRSCLGSFSQGRDRFPTHPVVDGQNGGI